MMFLNGVIGAMEGLVALVNDDYYPVGPSGLALNVNYTVWGFVHLIVGIAVFAAGIGVLSGNVPARAVGVVLAGVNALVAMVFIQAAPGWGFLVIAVDLLVIYALTIHGGELRDPAEPVRGLRRPPEDAHSVGFAADGSAHVPASPFSGASR